MKTVLGLITLLFCNSATLAAPLSKGTTLLIEPKTLQYYASFIRSTITLTDNRVMAFPAVGTSQEELIRIPLGEIDPHAVIRITVAKREEISDSDPHIGLTDGVTENVFELRDDNNGRCLHDAGTSILPSVPPDSDEHYEYVLLFEPFQRYGACSHLGGHVTTGYFNNLLEPTKGLDFIVRRENTGEQYGFYYFLIEVL